MFEHASVKQGYRRTLGGRIKVGFADEKNVDILYGDT